jgi:hypothetical protein
MQDLTSGKLRFVTVPWGAYAPDANRVALRQPDAAQLFAAIRNDKTVPTQSKQPAAAPKIPANQVRVRVYNASGRDGLAGRVVDDLKSQGFHASIGGTIQKLAPKSRVLYGTGADQHAQTVNALLTNPPQPGLRPKGMPGMVDLVIGTDWTSLKGAASGGIPAQQGEVKGTDPVCAK